MNASLVSNLVTSLFLIFVIIGFICGWVRGVSKSLTRLIIVVIVAVLSFFIVPAITKALLEMDISRLNIVLGDVKVLTVQDFITDMLRQIPVVEDIIESSPTFETVIQIAPQVIVNVILFIVAFFLMKWISMIIYWIIAGIFFSRKKMKDKDKHNFIGALVGSVQGLMVAFVLLVPFYGIIETARPVSAVMLQKQTAEVQTFNNSVYNVTEGNEEEKTVKINDAAKTID